MSALTMPYKMEFMQHLGGRQLEGTWNLPQFIQESYNPSSGGEVGQGARDLLQGDMRSFQLETIK